MKTFLQLLLTALLCLPGKIQAQLNRHIVVFTDKHNNPFSIQQPNAYLSNKAIERRNRQQLSVDSTDLPVNPSYLDSLRNAGDVTIVNTSKWLNQALIQTSDAAALNTIKSFSFVKKVSEAAPRTRQRNTERQDKLRYEMSPVRKSAKTMDAGNNYFNYGNNYAQVNIHEGQFLHNKGYRGEGMTIAILDAGFYKYDTNPAFDSIRLNNQVLGTWDFVKNKESVTEEHDHGMVCFSIMAANRPGKIVGTAPKAKYYLFRTEDAATEYQVEEQNWVAAAERADSLGVDLISSSLGYYEFDDAATSYSYNDMDGKTSIITRGAEYAAQKGIFVTNSAGNSGGDAWHYIIAPADGAHVMAVGAVDVSGNPAWFSSYGPASDNRVKPDVASVGAATVMAGYDGNPVTGNGTSLSNPNMAGLITCLWQAFPEFTNAEIFDAVKKSANRYNSPNDRVGYGIPNMRIAYEILSGQKLQNHAEQILGNDWLKAYPVPFTSGLTLLLNPQTTGNATLQLFSDAGRLVYTKNITVNAGVIQYLPLNNLGILPPGVYWIKYNDGKNKRLLKIVK
ncbi:MAG: S8 family serine peptidase [Chitinophagaceae bacterium]|nr:S8 family serine peptidase [Chitinophagaceae bacterium]